MLDNTNSLGKKTSVKNLPNCLNNVPTLITLSQCKMGFVLMLGLSA